MSAPITISCPLNVDSVPDETDRMNLLELDRAISTLYEDMPVLSKRILASKHTHFIVEYTWQMPSFMVDGNTLNSKILDLVAVENYWLSIAGSLRIQVRNRAHQEAMLGPPLMLVSASTSKPSRKRPRTANSDTPPVSQTHRYQQTPSADTLHTTPASAYSNNRTSNAQTTYHPAASPTTPQSQIPPLPAKSRGRSRTPRSRSRSAAVQQQMDVAPLQGSSQPSSFPQNW